MNSKNDVLQEIEEQENRELQKRLNAQQKKKRLVRMCPPRFMFDYPIYQPLKEAIILKDKNEILPRRWEELEIDFENKNSRYCKLKNSEVHKVSNMYNYEQVKNECIAIPIEGTLYHQLDNELKEYIELYKFIQISRRLIQGAGFSENRDFDSTSLEEVLDLISKEYNYILDIRDFEEFEINFDLIPQNIKEIFMKKNAILSEDRIYRYMLSRVWDKSKQLITFIGLNPSTADENKDDPTIRKCIKYAKSWGYGGMYMLNLFAYRTAYPDELFKANDPIGNANNKYIKEYITKSDKIICVWGNNGAYLNRSQNILTLLNEKYCLKINKSGEPSHPLYLKSSLLPIKLS